VRGAPDLRRRRYRQRLRLHAGERSGLLRPAGQELRHGLGYRQLRSRAGGLQLRHDPATWTPGTTAWFPPLRSDLNLYLEYSNEVWNGGCPFCIENGYNAAQAAAEVAALGTASDLNWDSMNANSASRLARSAKEISDTFRSIWGDADMPEGSGRIRPIYATQMSSAARWVSNGMTYLFEYWSGATANLQPWAPGTYALHDRRVRDGWLYEMTQPGSSVEGPAGTDMSATLTEPTGAA
jgi:hypothetical protein